MCLILMTAHCKKKKSPRSSNARYWRHRRGAMATPDGTVFIDTRIDTKTFNRGVKGLSDSFGGVLGSIKKIGKALSTAFLGGSNIFAIIKNLAKFAAAAFIGGS